MSTRSFRHRGPAGRMALAAAWGAIALMACWVAWAQADDKENSQRKAVPNFSGTWTLNRDKSDFGQGSAPRKRVETIEHKEPRLHDAIAQEGPMGEVNMTFDYTTDGKESLNEIAGREAKSIGRWEGEVLVLTTKMMTVDGAEVRISDRWTLAPDGRTLTRKRHYEGPQGTFDQTLVMEKTDKAKAPDKP